MTHDDPVGEVAVGRDLEGAQDGQVHVSAADHAETLAGGEDGAALQVSHGLLAYSQQCTTTAGFNILQEQLSDNFGEYSPALMRSASC